MLATDFSLDKLVDTIPAAMPAPSQKDPQLEEWLKGRTLFSG